MNPKENTPKRPYYELRPRADGDGWTLLSNGIAVAGGGRKHCLSVLEEMVWHDRETYAPLTEVRSTT